MKPSSFNQENSIEKHHSSLNPESYSQIKSYHLRNFYPSNSNLNSVELKHQNAPTQASEGLITMNGVQDDNLENSLEFRSSKEEFQPRSRLEAVPERSIEYSEKTNKTSRLDSETFKTRGEFELEDKKISTKSVPSFLKESFEARYEPHSKTMSGNLNIKVDESIPKDLRQAYMSPRQDVRESGSQSVKYKDANGKRLGEKEVLSTSKKHNYNHASSNSSSRSIGGSYDRGNGHHEKGPQNRLTSQSEAAANISRKPYLEGLSTKRSLVERQSFTEFSDYDLRSNVKSAERYDSNRLSKTDFQSENLRRGASHQTQEQAEIAELKDRNEKLEAKLKTKEKLLQEMKGFYEAVYKNYREANAEIEKLKKEREMLLAQKNRSSQMEDRDMAVRKENEELRLNEVRKNKMIGDLENQVNAYKAEITFLTNKFEAKIETLKLQLRRVEDENQSLRLEMRQSDTKRETYLHQLELSNEEENLTLRRNLEESYVRLQTLTARNEELVQRVETLKKFNQERERAYREKLDESLQENRRALEENVGQIKDEIRLEFQAKINHYKAKIDKLVTENDNLKLELQSRPTLRKFKENEARIQALESELEEAKMHMHDHKKKGHDNTLPIKILREVAEELEIDSIGEVVPKVKELHQEHKADSKFVNSVLDLVHKCSPAGYFEGRPNPKQAWKWIKLLMEEYMTIKRQEGGYELGTEKEILRIVMDFLRVKNKNEVPSKLRQIVGDNATMSKLIAKVKILLKLEWVNSLNELDRRLDKEINPKYEETFYKSLHYPRNNT